jgi:hypothetical protein
VRGTHFGDLSVSYLSKGANGVTYLARGKGGVFVVKVPKTIRKDNPVREYLVGNDLNEYERLFPTIVHTEKVYGYQGDSQDIRQVMSTLKPIGDGLHSKPTINDACANAGHTVLFLHAVAGDTLKSHRNDQEFAKHELLGILLQVYYTSYMLRKEFTHNDLHCSNVLVYQPNPGHSVKFRFVFNASSKDQKEVLEIKCSYVAQVIDYGRMYSRRTAKMERRDLDDIFGACNIREECGDNGQTCGFSYRKPGHRRYDVKNESQDLRLLSEVHRFFGDYDDGGHKGSMILPEKLQELVKKVQFGHGTKSKRYFTRETVRDEHPELSPDLIYDVKDGIEALGTLALTERGMQSKLPEYCTVTVDGIKPFGSFKPDAAGL